MISLHKDFEHPKMQTGLIYDQSGKKKGGLERKNGQEKQRCRMCQQEGSIAESGAAESEGPGAGQEQLKLGARREKSLRGSDHARQ